MKKEKKPKIYSTENGAVTVKSPTKLSILSLLEERERTGREIRENIDRSKSTISVHLSDLEKRNLIKEKQHEQDKRKKIYSPKFTFLGESKIPFDEHYEKILNNFNKASGNKYEFLKTLFHTIRYGLSSFGFDIKPALKEMGHDIGEKIAEDMQAKDMNQVLIEIKEFWDKNGLGKIKIIEEDLIEIEDCFDCSRMPNVDQTLCSLDEGIIEGIIEKKLGIENEVTETKCHGLGNDVCEFKIKIND
ncbi:MAG: putative transcriptional regulator containing HTH and 4VR domain [Candidatus Methanohalarchaeum thermophilum]|uniref:Transcriptional regulator containing HTH and 4VR domain n=1 Tax=Methanohalarchaeum thermophilum TaxID=1903181 RepID=A0A1Q6DTF1_METT1|nr:MAG: putative transcriptional regulator containing HTH and 4VR domain [Candidatus Methanohalarchaeum thermophilum]